MLLFAWNADSRTILKEPGKERRLVILGSKGGTGITPSHIHSMETAYC
jgi:hypothetical protein